MSTDSTHFGKSTIPRNEKSEKIKALFDDVAQNYDLMNDLMSFGLHRVWKYITVRYLPLSNAQHVLDIASGSGDITEQMHSLNPDAQYTCLDPSTEMLLMARKKLQIKKINFVQSFCEDLPFSPKSFDLITIGFGFRNFTNQPDALRECLKVLKPGGTLAILEFSQSKSGLFNSLYQPYAQHVIPFIGGLIANNKDAYKYLSESIEVHPPASQVIHMLSQAGFVNTDEHSFMTGLVRCHIAQRPS